MKSSEIRRILFTTDLHGSDIVFRKMLNLAKSIKVDLIIMGGDVAGKIFIPIIADNGIYKVNLNGQIRTLKNENELKEIEKEIANEGSYFKIISKEEFERITNNSSLLNEIFQAVAIERLSNWTKIADESLKGTAIKILISGGNDDSQALVDSIKNSESVVNVDQSVYTDYQPFSILNVGFSNPTPFNTPREVSEDKLEEIIMKLINKSNSDPDHMIYNIHVPPYGTTLDLAPKVITNQDGTLSISMKGGEAEMIHAGSIAVRKLIERFQPALSLHGHIHEARAAERIGKTLCINPGSSYTEGTLNSAVINIREGKILGYQLMIS